MKRRNRVVFALVIVMLVMVALSVSTALASGIDRLNPAPEEHPPVCHRVETFAPGVVGLECFDVGKDIVNVQVKANTKYELSWNAESVTLWVYVDRRTPVAVWNVYDKAGSITSGQLP